VDPGRLSRGLAWHDERRFLEWVEIDSSPASSKKFSPSMRRWNGCASYLSLKELRTKAANMG
jgi:hypothetical protein